MSANLIAANPEPVRHTHVRAPWGGIGFIRQLAQDTLPFLQKMHAQHGDLLHLRLLGKSYYWAFKPEWARQTLVQHAPRVEKQARQLAIFRALQGQSVLTTQGEDWQRQRRLLMPAFLPAKMNTYAALIQHAMQAGFARDLPTEVGASTVLNVGAFTTRITMDVILRVLFSHQPTLAESTQASHAIQAVSRQGMREMFWLFTPPDWFPYPGRTQKMRNKTLLNEMISQHIALRQQTDTPPDDLLTMLLGARDETSPAGQAAGMSAAEIQSNCLNMFLAGHDTSASALAWWMGLMATHPDYAEKVRAEWRDVVGNRAASADDCSKLPWLNATLKESLRLYPSLTALFVRTTLADIQLGEHTIPKGAHVNIPIWHIQRDPRWFPEPSVFRPERFLPDAPDLPRGAYMPFGAGPHFCIGQQFAMVEMALLGGKILQDFELEWPENTQMPAAVVDIVLKPQHPLKLKITRRPGRLPTCATHT